MKKLASVWVLLFLAIISLVVLVGIVVFERLPQFIGNRSYVLVEVSDDSESSMSAKLVLDFVESPKKVGEFESVGLPTGKVEFGINKETVATLEKVLPTKLILSIEGKRVWFRNGGIGMLSTSAQRQEIMYSTGSANFKMSYSDISDLEMEASDVQTLVREATRGGSLYMSDELVAGLPTLGKINNFQLSISGDAMEGWIDF